MDATCEVCGTTYRLSYDAKSPTWLGWKRHLCAECFTANETIRHSLKAAEERDLEAIEPTTDELAIARQMGIPRSAMTQHRISIMKVKAEQLNIRLPQSFHDLLAGSGEA